MKMLLIICQETRQDELRSLITRHGVHAYSEVNNVLGEGKTGKKMGTQIWPEESILIFTVVEKDKAVELLSALRDFQKQLYKEEGFRVFALPAESLI
jgi:hypothetical protein